MSGELVVATRNIEALAPQCERLVEPVGMNSKRFIASMILACEKNPRLLQFDPRQIQMAAYSCMTLGLEPDGVTGQMFLLPFGGKNPCIQPVTGYKGLNTVAARAGIMIMGDDIREGDTFDTRLQAGQPFVVDRKFGGRQSAPIIGAWAQAMLPNRAFSTPVLMDLSELNAVRAKSPGARKRDSPWNDVDGPGFAAMCAKTAKRRLQRSLPFLLTPGLESLNISQHGLAMTMDQASEDQGRHAVIGSDHQVHVGDPIQESDGLPWRIATGKGSIMCRDGEDWTRRWKAALQSSPTIAGIDAALDRNSDQFAALREAGCTEDVAEVEAFAEARKQEIDQ